MLYANLESTREVPRSMRRCNDTEHEPSTGHAMGAKADIAEDALCLASMMQLLSQEVKIPQKYVYRSNYCRLL